MGDLFLSKTKADSDNQALGESPKATRLDNSVINHLSKPKKTKFIFDEVIVSGNLLEYRSFTVPKIKNKPKVKGTIKYKEDVDRSKDYEKRRISRAINRIKRQVAGNFGEVRFLTLTFNNKNSFDITNPDICKKYFRNFIARLKTRYGKFKHICVPEFQKRGAVHYHIIYDLPYIKKSVLAKIWGLGFVDIKRFKNKLICASYIAKYLSKQAKDKRFKGKRMYYASKGMSPSCIYYSKKVFAILKILERNNILPSFDSSYESQFNSTVKFKQYILPFNLKLDFSPDEVSIES